jgi:hypothetical protein
VRWLSISRQDTASALVTWLRKSGDSQQSCVAKHIRIQDTPSGLVTWLRISDTASSLVTWLSMSGDRIQPAVL